MKPRKPIRRLVLGQFTKGQRQLIKKHGTPAEFAIACYRACPEFVSMDEATAAAQKYWREFIAA